MIREYKTIRGISEPLVLVGKVSDIAAGELAEITLPNGEKRRGAVIEADGDAVLVQLCGDAAGIASADSRARFFGRQMELAVSGDMLGRVFDGMGAPIDGGPRLLPDASRSVNGRPVNPMARAGTQELIQTGVSAIDGFCPLITGRTLAVFSETGLPHLELAAQIAARVTAGRDEAAVVLAVVGLTRGETDYLVGELDRAGIAERSAVFINQAGDPPSERAVTPKIALTAAEYLAFELDMRVLVIMADMTNAAFAAREISAAKKEPTGRLGYPASLGSDMAALFERAGRRAGKTGSVTLLPIFTMPGDAAAHPIFDAVSAAADGRLVLSREKQKLGIDPPIDLLASRSRGARKHPGETASNGERA